MYVFVDRVWHLGKAEVILNENVVAAVLCFNSKLVLRGGEKRVLALLGIIFARWGDPQKHDPPVVFEGHVVKAHNRHPD